MKRNKKHNEDSEVYILGANTDEKPSKTTGPLKWFAFFFCVALVAGGIFWINNPKDETVEYYFEPEEVSSQSTTVVSLDSSTLASSEEIKGYIEIQNDTINDVPLQIYIPHHATMSLMVGMPDKKDSTIVFATMAADIRKDNEEIVGDFVLDGQRLSKGVAKKGFCAIIDNAITIGTDESTSLLQETILKKGDFFRQYSLVMNGEVVENKPKNKSFRRAIGVRNDKVMMVESTSKESFHDFSQALVDLGFSDAIYLVGGDAYGWCYNEKHELIEFGEEEPSLPKNISYIVWQTK